MSFYRKMLASVAVFGFVSCGFAEVQTVAANKTSDASIQLADASNSAGETANEQDKADLNKATVKDLRKVKGLTAARAKSIVNYRKKHGDFKSVDDLRQVKGFKKLDDKTFNEITEQLTIN